MLDLDADYGDLRSPSPRSIRSEVDSVAELTSANMVRNAVMINFLRQRQLTKLWSDTNLDEGVVLKRAKGDFVSQPEELSTLPGGFYDQVKRLNVKVGRVSPQWHQRANPLGMHDYENVSHSDFPQVVESSICSTLRWTTPSSNTRHFISFSMSKASLCRLYPAPGYACRMGRRPRAYH